MKYSETLMIDPSQHTKRRSHPPATKQILTAHQMQKLVKNDEAIFLAVIRTTNEAVTQMREFRGGKRIRK